MSEKAIKKNSLQMSDICKPTRIMFVLPLLINRLDVSNDCIDLKFNFYNLLNIK